MTRIDLLARALAQAESRRRTLAVFAVVPAWLFGLLPDRARAACKKVDQNCDRNRDCCDHARCRSGKCRCRSGFTACRGQCRHLDTDELHCGECDFDCSPGSTCCSGVCRNRDQDVNNCGACGNTCAAGQECVAGDCVLPPGGCPVGASGCDAEPAIGCGSGGQICHCHQSIEGATVCIDVGAGFSACGACRSSDDCASFGTGAICVDTLGTGTCCQAPFFSSNRCMFPCEAER